MAKPKRVFYAGINQTYVHRRAVTGKRGDEHCGMGFIDAPYFDCPTFDGRLVEKQLSADQEEKVMMVRDAFDDGVLDCLSPRQRQCFTEVIISGDTYDVVAKRNHLSRGAVQSYVRSAAQKIRRRIEKNNG